jgi:cephalosporin-C deacetylase
MGPTCPPSTVYAAYNAWTGPKQIREIRFNGHEGGGGFHVREQFASLAEHIWPPALTGRPHRSPALTDNDAHPGSTQHPRCHEPSRRSETR